MPQHYEYVNCKIKQKKLAPLKSLNLKYINCSAKKVVISRSDAKGLIVSESIIDSASCHDITIEHFIISDNTIIRYSHFTNVRLCQNGAITDTGIHDNIFNSVVFHNIHFCLLLFFKKMLS